MEYKNVYGKYRSCRDANNKNVNYVGVIWIRKMCGYHAILKSCF